MSTIPDPLTIDNVLKAGINPSHIKVLLDGHDLDYVVEASEKQGYALVMSKNNDGKFYLNDEGDIRTFKVKGEVEIIIDKTKAIDGLKADTYIFDDPIND